MTKFDMHAAFFAPLDEAERLTDWSRMTEDERSEAIAGEIDSLFSCDVCHRVLVGHAAYSRLSAEAEDHARHCLADDQIADETTATEYDGAHYCAECWEKENAE